jgi:hypothetical protein
MDLFLAMARSEGVRRAAIHTNVSLKRRELVDHTVELNRPRLSVSRKRSGTINARGTREARVIGGGDQININQGIGVPA